eukprot:jgi/Picre1/27992/NNA_000953.t1
MIGCSPERPRPTDIFAACPSEIKSTSAASPSPSPTSPSPTPSPPSGSAVEQLIKPQDGSKDQERRGEEDQGEEAEGSKRSKEANVCLLFFMADVRAKTKADNPDAGVAELGKIMGAEWNKIKETAAADTYKEKATADKARYEKEMKKYKGE